MGRLEFLAAGATADAPARAGEFIPVKPAAARSRAKRGFDLVVACTALFFLFPLFLVIVAFIFGDSQGPLLFVQRRTGLDGRPIRVYKFRTMRVMDDGEHVRHASRQDDRVTRVGAFLRRSSLDELPQLFNVVRGDMSLVGPRPHALAHDQYYGALVGGYIHRFRVRPGITGLAQVSGCRGEIHSLDHMIARVEFDNTYIETWKLSQDLKILARTVMVTLSQVGAY